MFLRVVAGKQARSYLGMETYRVARCLKWVFNILEVTVALGLIHVDFGRFSDAIQKVNFKYKIEFLQVVQAVLHVLFAQLLQFFRCIH